MKTDQTDVYYMTSAIEALANYMTHDYCLVILDVHLSDVNGMELLRTIRRAKHIPILVLTDFVNADDKLMLFEAGADACIERSQNVTICVAQANKLIYHYVEDDINHGLYKPVTYGSELIINSHYRQVMINGKYVSLTRREFDLLHYFADHQKQVFTCEQLYDQVWGGDSPVAIKNIVKSQIKRLRKKLSDVGKNYIRTEWGIGYKFVLSDE